MKIRLATRRSPLALVQADRAATAINAVHDGIEVELVEISSVGDENPRTPIDQLGETGVFTKALEAALLTGEADAAVHSAKDLPTADDEVFALPAFVERADPRDALCAKAPLDKLPDGAVIGTGSPRRRAQLAALRPDLVFEPLRGNIATRLKALNRFDGVVIAAAALDRLGLSNEVTEIFDPDRLLPAQGQGAIVIEAIADSEVREILEDIDDLSVRIAVLAERSCVRAIGGGCQAPVAALAEDSDEGLVLTAAVFSADGAESLRRTRRVIDPTGDGEALGLEMLEMGAGRLLSGSVQGEAVEKLLDDATGSGGAAMAGGAP